MTPVNPEILNALTAGIGAEIASYVFYLEAAKKAETAEFKSVLEDLALEEKKHFQILERQHSSLIKSEQWISLADVLKGEGLPEINEDMAGAHTALIDEVRNADSMKTVLDIAYRLEVEAFEMFDKYAHAATSPEGTKIFTELAKFEKGHMRQVKQMIADYVK